MRHLLLIIASLGISGCTQRVATDPLCLTLASPDHYVGKRITATGIAQMHQHSSTLRSVACPDRQLLLKLDPDDNSDAANGKLSPAGAFFAKLAGRRESSVVVSGHLIRTPTEIAPYALVVESGSHKP